MPRDSSWNTAVVLHALQQHVGGFGSPDRQRVDVERRIARCDALRIDDRRTARSMIVSVRSPRKSNFTRPACLDVVLVELRDDAAAAGLAVERREVGQHRRRDHYAARVRAGVARQALERAREVDQVARPRLQSL
jgi:hypothetical protein